MLGSILTGCELQKIRADIQSVAMTDTCNVLRRTSTPDGSGGTTLVWNVHVADVPCFFGQQFFSAFAKDYGLKMTTDQPFKVILPFGTDVTYTDRIQYSGREYEIIADMSPRTDDPFTLLIVRFID